LAFLSNGVFGDFSRQLERYDGKSSPDESSDDDGENRFAWGGVLDFLKRLNLGLAQTRSAVGLLHVVFFDSLIFSIDVSSLTGARF